MRHREFSKYEINLSTILYSNSELEKNFTNSIKMNVQVQFFWSFTFELSRMLQFEACFVVII